MKETLTYLFQHNTLLRIEAKSILLEIAKGKYPAAQLASFFTVFNMRNPTVDEINGFCDALMELAVKVNLDADAIDVCGTGGDGKDTFNISTLSAFVIAGAGFKVTKHGNYSATSVSGSSHMLEYFGYQFSNSQDRLKTQLEKANICFLHAPLFHPAMKSVAAVRKEIGVKTFFNILGPLVNPSTPKYQMAGVFNLKTARLYDLVLKSRKIEYAVVHALDGYDEISLTGDTKVISSNGEKIYSPKDFSTQQLNANTIKGGNTIAENAAIFKSVLENKSTKEQLNVVIANSAMGIKTITNNSMEDCLQMATESIHSQKALEAFKNAIEFSK